MQPITLPNSDYQQFKTGQPVKASIIYLEHYLHDLLKDGTVKVTNRDHQSDPTISGFAVDKITRTENQEFIMFYIRRT